MGLLRSLTWQPPIKEVAHERCDFIALILQRKVTTVEKVQLRVRKIAQVRIRAIGWEYLIILSSHDESRRPPRAKELLELRVQRNVRTIVLEQVEHDLIDARPAEQRLIMEPGVRGDA